MSLIDSAHRTINGWEEIKLKGGSLGNQQAVEGTVSLTLS